MSMLENKKIKLMQITHDLAIGGLQQVVVNICRTIDRDKFDITVLCLRNLGEYVSEVEKMGIKVLFLPQKKRGTDYLSFLKVAKILKQEKTEIIHTHNTQPFIDGTIGALMSDVKTIVHTDHARQFPDKKRYMLAEWFMSHFVYKVVAVSDSVAENLKKYEKIAASKIIVIHNGIDESKYNITINKQEKMKELGIKKGGPIIGLGARLTEQKGITYLIKAMPAIIRAYPDVTLVIAGEGEYESTLKKEAADIGVDSHIIFAGMRLDMPELLKLFDLYILPSLSEGLPMGLLEAMAAGCPIVATNVGGIPTAITHGVNGTLIEPKNPLAISTEIIRLLADQEIRTKYVQKGTERFKLQFSAGMMMRSYEKLYLKEKLSSYYDETGNKHYYANV